MENANSPKFLVPAEKLFSVRIDANAMKTFFAAAPIGELITYIVNALRARTQDKVLNKFELMLIHTMLDMIGKATREQQIEVLVAAKEVVGQFLPLSKRIRSLLYRLRNEANDEANDEINTRVDAAVTKASRLDPYEAAKVLQTIEDERPAHYEERKKDTAFFTLATLEGMSRKAKTETLPDFVRNMAAMLVREHDRCDAFGPEMEAVEKAWIEHLVKRLAELPLKEWHASLARLTEMLEAYVHGSPATMQVLETENTRVKDLMDPPNLTVALQRGWSVVAAYCNSTTMQYEGIMKMFPEALPAKKLAEPTAGSRKPEIDKKRFGLVEQTTPESRSMLPRRTETNRKFDQVMA